MNANAAGGPAHPGAAEPRAAALRSYREHDVSGRYAIARERYDEACTREQSAVRRELLPR